MKNFHYEVKKSLDITFDEVYTRVKHELKDDWREDYIINLFNSDLMYECVADILQDIVDEKGAELLGIYEVSLAFDEWAYDVIDEVIEKLRKE